MRGDRLRLSDIIDAIMIIERDTPDSREKFDADTPIKSHILLHIQIIGEAASKLSQSLRDQTASETRNTPAAIIRIVIHREDN